MNDLGPADFIPDQRTYNIQIQKRVGIILSYWFGNEDDPEAMADFDRDTSLPKAWLAMRLDPKEETEARMRQLFTQDDVRFEAGNYTQWEEDRDGILATILLCDPIMRSLHNNMAAAYKHEEKAIELARKVMTDESLKGQYLTAERLFIIQPLMRSETLENVTLAIDLIQEEISLAKELGNRSLQKRFVQML